MQGAKGRAEEGVHGRKTDPGEGGRTQGCPDGNPFMQQKRNRVCRTGPVRKGAEKGWYHRVCAMDRDACMPRRIPEHLLAGRPGNACTEKTVCPGRADSFETVLCSSFTGQPACASCFQAKADAMPGIPIFRKVPGDGANTQKGQKA